MANISSIGKIVSLLIVFVTVFFTYITSVNSASLLGRKTLDAQKMRSDLQNNYNEIVSDISSSNSQSKLLSMRKSKMTGIETDSKSSFFTLGQLQDEKTGIDPNTKEENSNLQKRTVIIK